MFSESARIDRGDCRGPRSLSADWAKHLRCYWAPHKDAEKRVYRFPNFSVNIFEPTESPEALKNILFVKKYGRFQFQVIFI